MSEALRLPSSSNKTEIYSALLPQIASLISEETDLIANLANVAAVLHTAFGHHWTGFYLRKGSHLVLGPFQGPLACTRIQLLPKPRGVCGASAVSKQTIVVPYVDEFPGHIACSPFSKSEIVVPLVFLGRTELVLDIDSEYYNEFDDIDAHNLEVIIGLIAKQHYL